MPVLYGVNQFQAPEVLVVSAVSAVAGSLVRARVRPPASQVLFNAADLVLSGGSCLLAYNGIAGRIPYLPVTMSVMVSLYFGVNTLLVSGILSLIQGRSLGSV